MKTEFTIIEVGPIGAASDMHRENRAWVPVEFAGDEPQYRDLKRILDPLFPGRNWEHVRVQGRDRACANADMFVDDMGAIEGMSVNEMATVVYWTATFMREISAKTHGYEYEELFQMARDAAVGAVKVAQPYPLIRGRAVLFRARVWF